VKTSDSGYEVAVIGASSLLGKELVTALRERKFPVSRLVKIETQSAQPELPILDLERIAEDLPIEADANESNPDFAFLASALPDRDAVPEFLRDGNARCAVIDLRNEAAGSRARMIESGGWRLVVPFLDREFATPDDTLDSKRIVAPHPATIMLGALLLRLSRSAAIDRVVAHVFAPVSEIGAKGIEELQKQTVNLLSFQKIPEAVFGGQLAFNFLPRLARTRRGSTQRYRDELTDLETRVRSELQKYLDGRVPMPAVRLLLAPVFYSLAISVYVEAADPVPPELVVECLTGERVRVVKFSDQAPSQVLVTGSEEILVDAISPEPADANAVWIWATADNLRLAALNAIEIAEWIAGSAPPRSQPVSSNS
jgi:aspartate-semialdehyde dehydrogenase